MSKRQRRYSLFSFVFLVFSWETWNQRDEYCSIGRMEYTEFRTGIYLVEWKALTDAKRKFRNGRSIMEEEAMEDLQKLVIQYLAFYSNSLVWEVEWELVLTAKGAKRIIMYNKRVEQLLAAFEVRRGLFPSC